MQFSKFSILQKDGSAINKIWSLNIGRATEAFKASAITTRIFYNFRHKMTSPPLLVVDGALPSISNTLAQNYDKGIGIYLNIVSWGGNVINSERFISLDNVVYMYENILDNTKTSIWYEFRNNFENVELIVDLTLDETIELFNTAANLNLTTSTLTTCTNGSQTATFTNAVATDVYWLDVFNGFDWIPIVSATGLSGSTSNVYGFAQGDVTITDPIRIRKSINGGLTNTVLTQGLFACTGGSGSGSGSGPGQCYIYPYFDGGWNDTNKTLNWGETCTEYTLQIANDSQFQSIVLEDITTATINQYDIAPGTYYARVKNNGLNTAWSAVLTFVNT